MQALEWTMGIVLCVMALFLIIAVLMQSGKDKSLSGTISGGSTDTYFGKSRKKSFDKILARLTAVIAVLFCALVVVMYVVISKYYAG